MSLMESSFLFLALIFIAIGNLMQNYDIEHLKDEMKERITIEAGEKLINEIDFQCQRMDYDIDCLKVKTYGPIYGPMLEDEE